MQKINAPEIRYTLSFSEPQAHYVDVVVELKNFDSEYLDLKMPVWTPGSYLIREFSRHVESFEARTNAESATAISFEKRNKNTWRVYHSSQDVNVAYRVYGFETSVRTNFIDDSHAFISPAGTFFYVDGYLESGVTVQVELPKFWAKVSTGLQKTENVHTFYAANFDILYDSPLEIGNQDTWTFEAEGIPHEFAMVGPGNYDKDQLSLDIQKIVAEETKIWDSNPNDYYVFITHNYQSGSGGLEHLNSTVLGATRNNYNQRHTYNNFLGLVAHEYFHLWNVKRLRPKPLGPFNYEEENYTSLLWIMEGFTAYYDNLILRRCAFISEDEYLQLLSQDFNLVYNRPGHRLQSAGMASFDTWIKQYRPDENSPNTSISYYNKGALFASMIDLKILTATQGKMRLDDVLRRAYKQFYLIEERGFEESEFKALAEELTGVDLSDIFEAVYTTDAFDFNYYFQQVGYELYDQNKDNTSLTLGIRTASNDGRIFIKGVDRNSSAWIDGLNVNDELIGVEGQRIEPTGRELENALQSAQAGDQLEFLVSRDGLLRTIKVNLLPTDKKSYTIIPLENRSEEQLRLGSIWLNLSPTDLSNPI